MKITSPEMLAQALANARKQKALSQAAVAECVGSKQATVSNFENKPEKSRIETLFKLLASLNLELSLTERNAPDKKPAWDQEW